MLRFMGLQRIGHNWATELNWTEYPWLDYATISQRVLTFKAKFDTVCKAPLEENEFLEWFNLEKYELGEKQNLI